MRYICSFEDRYGSYGKIDLSSVERGATAWTPKLLLMSCLVISLASAAILLDHIMKRAKAVGVRLYCELASNDRNRATCTTCEFAGFQQLPNDSAVAVLGNDLTRIRMFPDVEVRLDR